MNTKEQASRFLMQATLGANYPLIEKVSQDGINNWLDQQLEHRVEEENGFVKDGFYQKTHDIWRGKSETKGFKKKLIDAYTESNINGAGNNPALPYNYYFRQAWWHKTLVQGNLAEDTNLDNDFTEQPKISETEANADNLVRHRVAQALSEILVISDNSILELDAEGMASYYDLLYKHALGSYKDLLTDVSLHPCMGVYLTHINNRKAEPTKNIHPDENYAREIMQLFTIGLFELNPDGSHQQENGKDIPTYNNDDIKEMARVFTGIKASEYNFEYPNAVLNFDGEDVRMADINGQEIDFNDGINNSVKMIPYVSMIKPMATEDDYHDLEPKKLLNGWIDLPKRTASGGSATLADIKAAVSRLVEHKNTAPFIAKKLIQQLVTSNPTPAYVKAVASAFGKSGNLKAAVKTILTYPQSNVVTIGDSDISNIQKLKSPLLRVTQLLRAFNVSNEQKRLWLIGSDIKDDLNHHILSSPTVFNFYKPDFIPHGDIEKENKVAPEFELYNAHTSISYVNMVYRWLFGEALPLVSTQIKTGVTPPHVVPELDAETLLANTQSKLNLNFDAELPLAADKNKWSQLIERVSLILTGKEQSSVKTNILDALDKQNDPSNPNNSLWIVQTVVFMIAVSPDFAILEA
ncbi:DUF1800 family protein [Parashewanella curva]|uniref:DUF1800 family protein n=1 Tax=Parashewanella curva TaxID=2338552 RepID=A0A3L8PXT1_9GAMM|nr:DUF1800 family protein [Parashewanella curva]RLV60130.1 DUF1800 family protein [Parashewanella curva]